VQVGGVEGLGDVGETPAVSGGVGGVEHGHAGGVGKGAHHLGQHGVGLAVDVGLGPIGTAVEHPALGRGGAAGLGGVAGDPAQRAVAFDKGGVEVER